MMAQDWHIDGKGRFAFPKRAKGKFSGKKAKPDTDRDGGDKRGMLDGDGGEMGAGPKMKARPKSVKKNDEGYPMARTPKMSKAAC